MHQFLVEAALVFAIAIPSFAQTSEQKPATSIETVFTAYTLNERALSDVRSIQLVSTSVPAHFQEIAPKKQKHSELLAKFISTALSSKGEIESRVSFLNHSCPNAGQILIELVVFEYTFSDDINFQIQAHALDSRSKTKNIPLYVNDRSLGIYVANDSPFLTHGSAPVGSEMLFAILAALDDLKENCDSIRLTL